MKKMIHTTCNKFRTTSAVFIGKNHISSGKPCQDAVATAESSDKHCRTVALCDGAGSRKLSHIGSTVVSQQSAKYLAENFDMLFRASREDSENLILLHVRTSLYETAVAEGCELRDLACTLLLAGLHSDGRYFIYHIGDGLVYGMSGGRASLISSYNHDIAENVTEFVTSKNIHSYMKRSQGDYTGFMLLSDGSEYFMKNHFELSSAIFNIAYILPQSRIEAEYKNLFCGLTDDSSVITLTSAKEIANVFGGMTTKMQSLILDLPEKTVKKRKRTYTAFLKAVSKSPVSVGEATRILHQHKASRTKRKLLPLIKSGIVAFQNGKYFY